MKIFPFIILIAVILHFSCSRPTDQGGYTGVFMYQNASNHHLSIKVYLRNNAELLIDLPEGATYKETIALTLPDPNIEQMDRSLAFSDSARVTFDDGKQIFYRPSREHNMDIYQRYIVTSSKKGYREQLFTFTENDYLAAK